MAFGNPIEAMQIGFKKINDEQNVHAFDVEPLGRFFNSEYWKISSYISTIVPSLFLSIFVSIVEYS
jgi:hypothetical protein